MNNKDFTGTGEHQAGVHDPALLADLIAPTGKTDQACFSISGHNDNGLL